MKIKVKTWILFSVLLVFVIVSAFTVAAALPSDQLLTPSNSETVSGTVNFMAEVNSTFYGANSNVSNVTFGVTPNGGSESLVCTNSSNVNNGTFANWTCSVSTTANFFDSGTYTITSHIWNDSSTELNSSSSTSVISDNTNPVVSITSPSDGASVSQGFTLTSSCSNSSSAVLKLDTQEFTMNVSGSLGSEVCTYVFSSGQPSSKLFNSVTVEGTDRNSDVTSSDGISFEVTGTSSRSRVGGGLAAAIADGGDIDVNSNVRALSVGSGLSDLFKIDKLNVTLLVLFLIGFMSFQGVFSGVLPSNIGLILMMLSLGGVIFRVVM